MQLGYLVRNSNKVPLAPHVGFLAKCCALVRHFSCMCFMAFPVALASASILAGRGLY